MARGISPTRRDEIENAAKNCKDWGACAGPKDLLITAFSLAWRLIILGFTAFLFFTDRILIMVIEGGNRALVAYAIISTAILVLSQLCKDIEAMSPVWRTWFFYVLISLSFVLAFLLGRVPQLVCTLWTPVNIVRGMIFAPAAIGALRGIADLKSAYSVNRFIKTVPVTSEAELRLAVKQIFSHVPPN